MDHPGDGRLHHSRQAADWCSRSSRADFVGVSGFVEDVLMYQVKFDTFRLELISLYIACNSTSNSSGHLAQLKRSMLYLRLNKLTGKLFFCCRISQSGSEFFCARRLIAWWVYWQMYNKCMRWWHRVIGQVFVNTMCLTTLGDRRSVESFVQVFPNQTRLVVVRSLIWSVFCVALCMTVSRLLWMRRIVRV